MAEIDAARPSATAASLAALSPDDFRDKATIMLASDLSDAGCDGSRAALRENAWDMNALVNYGLCLAVDNRIEQRGQLHPIQDRPAVLR